MGLIIYFNGRVVFAIENIKEFFFPVPRIGEVVQYHGKNAKVTNVQHNYNPSNMCVHVFCKEM